MTCKHAPSGCNYPEGDCPGTCLSKKTDSELRARIELEGTIFEITRGTDDLADIAALCAFEKPGYGSAACPF